MPQPIVLGGAGGLNPAALPTERAKLLLLGPVGRVAGAMTGLGTEVDTAGCLAFSRGGNAGKHEN